MKFEWKCSKSGDVVEIHRGSSPRPIHNYLSSKGMPRVEIADATADYSKYITRTNEYIISEGVSKSAVVEQEIVICRTEGKNDKYINKNNSIRNLLDNY